MTPIQPQRALIATHHLIGYAGSEVLTLELAIELRSMGWEVSVAALLTGEPMTLEFKKHGFRIVDLLREPSAVEGLKFDLAWIHHAPVLYELFLVQRIEAGTVVFSSLSHFEPLEAVPQYRDKVGLLLAHSIENGNHIKKELGLDSSQLVIFPNAVPGDYWDSRKKIHSPVARHVAIISNHPPSEVLEATALLKKQGMAITHIGVGGTPVLMSPGLLLNYDVVITIGKTVPYCFALKVPVYCYDHFGGPGWLSEENFVLASQNNFSGRGFFKRTPETIADEIVKGYCDALGQLDVHMNFAERLLNLRENLTSLFARPRILSPEKETAIGVDQVLMQHTQYIRLAKIFSAREAELSRELLRVKSTVSWHITKPLRFIWNRFFRSLK